MSAKRIVVNLKAEEWKKLGALAIKEDLSIEEVVDAILAAAIKVMEEGNGKKD